MEDRVRIAVIGHDPKKPRLPQNFVYLRRKSDFILYPTLPTLHNFNSPSFVWSEFAAWFENSSVVENTGVTGLYHYRCALNLYSRRLNTFPVFLRYFFLKNQVGILVRKTNFLIVGEPNQVPETVWGHFQSAHPESQRILESACKHYDFLTGRDSGSSEIKLRNSQFYYPRNIYVSDTSFGKDWLALSFQLAEILDQEFQETPDNRWGGFVLERIFTLFVEDYAKENKIGIEMAQQTYFITVATWIKIQLLKFDIVKRVRTYVN